MAPGRGSAQHREASETLQTLAGNLGLDYLFSSGLDALMFSVELGQPLSWTGAMGYPAVSG
jgi:hypothetical protein